MAEWRREEAAKTTTRHERVAAKDDRTRPTNIGTVGASFRQAPKSYSKEEYHPRQLMAAAGGGRGGLLLDKLSGFLASSLVLDLFLSVCLSRFLFFCFVQPPLLPLSFCVLEHVRTEVICSTQGFPSSLKPRAGLIVAITPKQTGVQK